METGFEFNDAVLKDAMRRLYEKKYNPLKEIDEELFNEFWDIYNSAADSGLQSAPVPLDYADKDADFHDELKRNNGVFAAFKTHRMQNDMAAMLTGEDGKLKPFHEWERDTASIREHHVKHWLKTEYSTAVRRARLAAEWRQFEREKDILPNIEWMKTTAVTPGKDHKPFWGVILPIGHPFWNAHRPGDRWGCKCGWRSTDADIVPPPDDTWNNPEFAPAAGLENNPGKDAMLFSFAHPYFAAAYWAYKKLKPVVEKLIDKQVQKRRDIRVARKGLKKFAKDISTSGFSKKVSISFGKVDEAVLDFAKNNKIIIGDDSFTITDDRMLHSVRDAKTQRGQSVKIEEIFNLPKNINRYSVYYDSIKRNFLYVKEDGEMVDKFIFEPNYNLKADGRKRRAFALISSGKIDGGNLKNKRYIKIK